MFADAVDARNDFERNHSLRRVGDVALFVAGFFADGLEKAAVDVDYYVYMGGGAYRSLSIYTRGSVRGRALAAVFDELGAKFQDVVDVLNEVRDSAQGDTDEGLLRAYELWRKTGSSRAERLLRDHPGQTLARAKLEEIKQARPAERGGAGTRGSTR